MDEETTTNVPEDTGAQAQPDVQESTEAVQETTQTSQETTEATEPSTVDDNSEWLKKKGIDPSDPDAINKLAKSAREAERAMHQKAQKASELEKSMTTMSDESAEQVAEATGQDPDVIKRLQRMEVKDSIREFWDSNPDARNYEAKMAEIATTMGLYGTPESILKAAYAQAKLGDSDGVTSQVRKETLQNLAQKQQAAVPTGNAVNSSDMGSQRITPQNVDELVSKNSPEWYAQNRQEILRASGMSAINN